MRHRELLDNNHLWAAHRSKEDPEYFQRLSRQHKPHSLFIGCSDARVPAEVIMQANPGELFVHRNIANQAHATDPSLQAALQYAVEALKVTDVIVCGHEGCGGVRAALEGPVPPSVDSWVSTLRMIHRLHAEEIDSLDEEHARVTRLAELNVMEQVFNISRMPVIQHAWSVGAPLRIHGWLYGLSNGHLRDLRVTMDGPDTLPFENRRRINVTINPRTPEVTQRAS